MYKYICMYVCTYVCMYVCLHIYTRTTHILYIHIHACMQACMLVCLFVCLFSYLPCLTQEHDMYMRLSTTEMYALGRLSQLSYHLFSEFPGLRVSGLMPNSQVSTQFFQDGT